MAIHVRSYSKRQNGKKVEVSAHSKTGEKTNFTKAELQSMKDGEYTPKSSCIHRVSFDYRRSVMDVNIRGNEYSYHGASYDNYHGLIAARSTGSYYNKNIRGKVGFNNGISQGIRGKR